jgi:hypothetical protein
MSIFDLTYYQYVYMFRLSLNTVLTIHRYT